MTRRNPPSETKVAVVKALLQGGGMLALVLGAMFLLPALYSHRISPARIKARFPHYEASAAHALMPSLYAVLALAAFTAVAVLAVRYGRVWAGTWWRYRRRWASVLTTQGLTSIERKRVLIPQLQAVASESGVDVLTVALLPGQSPADWNHRAPFLAAAFGADTGRARAGRLDPARDVELVLTRSTGGGQGRRKALSPASTGPALMVLPRSPERELVALRAWSLQLSWASVRTGGQSWFAGRVRWNSMAHTGYYAIGGM